MKKTLFTIEGDGEFKGYTNGETWNGWATPYFTKEVAKKVIEHYARDVDVTYYDKAKDLFAVKFDEVTDEETEYFEGHTVSIEGEEVTLYPVGAYSWTWDEIK